MALNITDPRTLELVAKVAALTGESKTQAVRTALAERAARLDAAAEQEYERLMRVLREEI